MGKLNAFQMVDRQTGEKFYADVPDEKLDSFTKEAGERFQLSGYVPVQLKDRESKEGQVYKARVAPSFFHEWQEGIQDKFEVTVPETHNSPVKKPKLPGLLPSVLSEIAKAPTVTDDGTSFGITDGMWFEIAQKLKEQENAALAKVITPLPPAAPPSALRLMERLKNRVKQELFPKPVLTKEVQPFVTQPITRESLSPVLDRPYDEVVKMQPTFDLTQAQNAETWGKEPTLAQLLSPIQSLGNSFVPFQLIPPPQKVPENVLGAEALNLGQNLEKFAGVGAQFGLASKLVSPLFKSQQYLKRINDMARKSPFLARLTDAGLQNAATFAAQGQISLPLGENLGKRVRKFGESTVESTLFTGAGALGAVPYAGKALLPTALFGIGAMHGETPEDKAINGAVLVFMHYIGSGIGNAKAKTREAMSGAGFDRNTIRNVEDVLVANSRNLRRDPAERLNEMYRRNWDPAVNPAMTPESGLSSLNRARASYGLDPLPAPPGSRAASQVTFRGKPVPTAEEGGPFVDTASRPVQASETPGGGKVAPIEVKDVPNQGTSKAIPRLVPRRPDGSVGPYENMTPIQQIDHVIHGNKPAFTWDGPDAEVEKLRVYADENKLPFKVSPIQEGYSEILVGKNRESLDKLDLARFASDTEGKTERQSIEDVNTAVGKALGYTDADIQAFLPRIRPPASPLEKLTAAVTEQVQKPISLRDAFKLGGKAAAAAGLSGPVDAVKLLTEPTNVSKALNVKELSASSFMSRLFKLVPLHDVGFAWSNGLGTRIKPSIRDALEKKILDVLKSAEEVGANADAVDVKTVSMGVLDKLLKEHGISKGDTTYDAFNEAGAVIQYQDFLQDVFKAYKFAKRTGSPLNLENVAKLYSPTMGDPSLVFDSIDVLSKPLTDKLVEVAHHNKPAPLDLLDKVKKYLTTKQAKDSGLKEPTIRTTEGASKANEVELKKLKTIRARTPLSSPSRAGVEERIGELEAKSAELEQPKPATTIPEPEIRALNFLDKVSGNTPITVYHGTSSRNLPFIKKYGMLSPEEAKRRGITPEKGYLLGGAWGLSVAATPEWAEVFAKESVDKEAGEYPVVLAVKTKRGSIFINKEDFAATDFGKRGPPESARMRGGFVDPKDITFPTKLEEPLVATRPITEQEKVSGRIQEKSLKSLTQKKVGVLKVLNESKKNIELFIRGTPEGAGADYILNKFADMVLEADPTIDKKYRTWVASHLTQDSSTGFSFPEDTTKVQDALTDFERLTKLPAFKGNKDINSYKDFPALARVLDENAGLIGKRAGGVDLDKLPTGAEIVHKSETPEGLSVIKITTPEAAKSLCKGARWCVSDLDTAKNYLFGDTRQNALMDNEYTMEMLVSLKRDYPSLDVGKVIREYKNVRAFEDKGERVPQETWDILVKKAESLANLISQHREATGQISPFFEVVRGNKPVALIHEESGQFKDEFDEAISTTPLVQQDKTGKEVTEPQTFSEQELASLYDILKANGVKNFGKEIEAQGDRRFDEVDTGESSELAILQEAHLAQHPSGVKPINMRQLSDTYDGMAEDDLTKHPDPDVRAAAIAVNKSSSEEILVNSKKLRQAAKAYNDSLAAKPVEEAPAPLQLQAGIEEPGIKSAGTSIRSMRRGLGIGYERARGLRNQLDEMGVGKTPTQAPANVEPDLVKTVEEAKVEEPTARDLEAPEIDRATELANIDFTKVVREAPETWEGWKLERVEGGMLRATSPEGETYYAKGTNLFAPKSATVQPPSVEPTPPPPPTQQQDRIRELSGRSTEDVEVAGEAPAPTFESPVLRKRAAEVQKMAPRMLLAGMPQGFTIEDMVESKIITDWFGITNDEGAKNELANYLYSISKQYDAVAEEEFPDIEAMGMPRLRQNDEAVKVIAGLNQLYLATNDADAFRARIADLTKQLHTVGLHPKTAEKVVNDIIAWGGKRNAQSILDDNVGGGSSEYGTPDQLPSDFSFGGQGQVPDPLYGNNVPKGKQFQMDIADNPQPGFEKGKPVSTIEAIKAMEKVIKAAGGVGIMRTGSTPRREGSYKPKSDIMRLRKAGSIPTGTHETFHALLKAIFGSPVISRSGVQFDSRAKQEMVRLGKALYGEIQPQGGYSSEGWAEFGRHFLTTDDRGQSVAPKLHDWFTLVFLPQHPEVAKELKNTQAVIDRYRKQGSEKRVDAFQVEPSAIRERIAHIADELVNKFEEKWIDEAAIFDKLARVYEKNEGVKLNIEEDPFKLKSALWLTHHGRVHGWYEQGMTDLAGNITGPSLLEVGQLVREDPKGFMRWLVTKRARSLIDRGLVPGVEEKDVDFILNKPHPPAWDLAADKVKQWEDGVLKYAYDAGLLTQEMYDNIKAKSEHYIPFFRVNQTTEPNSFANWLSNLSNRHPKQGAPDAFKAFIGSGRNIYNPFYSMIDSAMNIVKKSHERMVIDSLLKLRHGEGMGEFIEEVPRSSVPETLSIKHIKNQLEEAGLDLEGADLNAAITFFMPSKFPSGMEPIVPLYEKGELKWFHVAPRLWDAMNSNEPFRMNVLADLILGLPKRVFNLATTGLRPAFSLITNPGRDLLVLPNQSRAKASMPVMLGSWLKNMFNLFHPTKNSEAFSWLQRMGGEISQPLGLDFPYTKHMVRGMFRNRIIRTAGHPVDALRQFLQIPESATRATEAEQLLKDAGWDGTSPLTTRQALTALLGARQVTSDFANYGRWTRALNSSVPFFGPSVAGLRAMGRRFKQAKQDKDWDRLIWRALMTLTIPTLLLWWKNKDRKWYRDMPYKERYTHWYFDDGKKNLIRHPRPFEWGTLFATLPEVMLDQWYEEDPEGVKQAVGFAFDQLSPFGTPSDPALPVAAKVAWEQGVNRVGYSGATVVPESLKFLPPGEQVGPYTSTLATWLGKEFPRVSPVRADHAIRGFFGGLGTDFLSLTGTGGVGAEREMERSDLPIIGTMFRRGGTEAGRSLTIEKLYDYSASLKTKHALSVKRGEVESQEDLKLRMAVDDATDSVNYLMSEITRTASRIERAKLNQRAIQIADHAQKLTNWKDAWKFSMELKFAPDLQGNQRQNNKFESVLQELKQKAASPSATGN